MRVGALSETCGSTRFPRVWIRPGHAGYIGPELGVDLHAPAVAVLSVGLDAPFELDTATHAPITTRSCFAPAHTAHRVTVPGGWILLLFVDPASTRASAIAGEMRAFDDPYGLGHRHERELIELCGSPDPDPDRIVARAVSGSTPAPDPRIERVAAAIRDNPDRTYRAEPVAASLGLSTTHFLRVFAQQCGTTFRGYQRWSRILRTMRAVGTGHDLTRAATDAGFATPSHFSETFHAMFGISATATLRSGIRFDLGA